MASRTTSSIVLATFALLGCGCGSTSSPHASASLVVVASTDVWGDIAATVAGPQAEVTAFITSPSQDPHSFQPSARDVLAVSKADVVIENGGGYDDFMDQLLGASDQHPTVLNAVDISGLAAPNGGDLNEHIWYDLKAVDTIAHRMALAFGSADPTHAARYLDNARTFTRTVDALRAREAAMKDRLMGTPVGITEPVPDYMLEAIGAVDKTPVKFSSAVEEGQEVSVSVLESTVNLYADHEVSALVYNEQTTGTLTDEVKAAATDAGVPVVAVTETLPGGLHYVGWMRSNLARLDRALSSP